MSNVVESCWQLLILLTTANFPDIMMPAYTENRSSALFFIFFLCFGLFFLMNVILAVIFSNFERISNEAEARHSATRRKTLECAFQLLTKIKKPPLSPKRSSSDSFWFQTKGAINILAPDNSSPHRRTNRVEPATSLEMEQSGTKTVNPLKSLALDFDFTMESGLEFSDSEDWIDMSVCLRLFEELNNYKKFSCMNRERMIELFQALDSTGSGGIALERFLEMCDVLSSHVFQDDNTKSEVEIFFPKLYNSVKFSRLRELVSHRYFELSIDILLVVNAIVIVLESAYTLNKAYQVAEERSWTTWEAIETGFSCIYAFEMILKFVIQGSRRYWCSVKNRFDCVITIVSIAVDIYAYLPNSYNSHTLVKVLLTARCLRVFRLIMNIER